MKMYLFCWLHNIDSNSWDGPTSVLVAAPSEAVARALIATQEREIEQVHFLSKMGQARQAIAEYKPEDHNGATLEDQRQTTWWAPKMLAKYNDEDGFGFERWWNDNQHDALFLDMNTKPSMVVPLPDDTIAVLYRSWRTYDGDPIIITERGTYAADRSADSQLHRPGDQPHG